MYKKISILVGFIFLGVLLYINSFSVPFQFDGILYIIDNAAIRDFFDFNAILNILSHPSRIVGFYTFALNYYFHQYNVFGYHLVNLLIHLINTFAVYCIVLNIFSTEKQQKSKLYNRREWIALWTALMFLSHPIQTQAVTYIYQRFASLATMFYLLTVLFYMLGRLKEKGLYFALASLTAILGMFTKQITLTLPIMIIMCEVMFFTRNFKDVFKLTKLKILIPVMLFLLIIPSFFMFDAGSILSGSNISGSHDGDLINAQTYALAQPRVVATYLRILIFPLGQNLDYDFPITSSIFQLSFIFSVLLLLTCFLLGIYFLKKKPLISFGIFWFFITLSVESGIIPIQHIIFEHRCYLPSFGFFFFVSVCMAYVMKSTRKFVFVGIIFILSMSFLTHQRNRVWQSEQIMWQDVINKSPHKSRGYTNLGATYINLGQYDKAIVHSLKSLSLYPDQFKAYKNLGNAYSRKGNYELALENFNKSLELNDEHADAYNHRGAVYMAQLKYDLALEDFNKALTLKPQFTYARGNKAAILLSTGEYDQAFEQLNHVLDEFPNYPEALNNRGLIYLHKKQYDQAIVDFSRAIKVNPNYAYFYYNRSESYFANKEYRKALADALKAKRMGHRFDEKYLKKIKFKIDYPNS